MTLEEFREKCLRITHLTSNLTDFNE